MREEARADGGPFGEPLAKLCDKLQAVCGVVQEQAYEDREYPYRVAGDFLRLCGLALLAFAWARTARVSRQLPESDPLRAQKLQTAQYFFAYELAQVDYRISAIEAAKASLAFLD